MALESATQATQRPFMVVHGLPAQRELSRSSVAQVAVLQMHWHVLRDRATGEAGSKANERLPLLEHLYRKLDHRLFGRGQRWSLAADSSSAKVWDGAAADQAPWHLAWRLDAPAAGAVDRLCIEYEGMPMAELEQAVRLRLGQPGGTLCVRVWLLQPSRAPRPLIQGWLRLDHRSLWRSIVLCALKVPALLRAADARRDRPAVGTRWLDAPPPVPISAARQVWRLISTSLLWSLYREQWQLEVGRSQANMRRPTSSSAVLRPPNSAFWADPFLLRRGARTWVLFEELPFDTNRGHISAVEIDDSGRAIAEPQVVLKEPWHLSYPFLWHEEGRYYMIPESATHRELALYEFVGEGRHWQRRATLIAGLRLADATVARHDGQLWMFATCADDGAFMDDSLHIYWADRIEGPWHPHALNPVKIDAGSARPAGSMWVADGVLHRVVQDCSSTYGGSVRCMRIVRLTPGEFEEEPVPGWAPPEFDSSKPWHTFNAIGELAVIDRLVRLPRWRSWQ